MEIKNDFFRVFLPNHFDRLIKEAIKSAEASQIVSRIWKHDWTVWGETKDGISNRLGWLHSPEISRQKLPAYKDFAEEVRQDGINKIVLLGMGGSSLAPEAFCQLMAKRAGWPSFILIDTTAPETIADASEKLNIEKTLFIIASKSGTTVETLSLLAYFHDLAKKKLGEKQAGRHFISITDKGTLLDTLSQNLDFRQVFYGEEDVGGRFSALTAFGLLPAACIGLPVEELIVGAAGAAELCRQEDVKNNPGVLLGYILGVCAKSGRDKLTVVTSPEAKPLFDWLEQLIAESTGKMDQGILPVFEHQFYPADYYGDDRFFALINKNWPSKTESSRFNELKKRFPLLEFSFNRASELGGLLFIWKIAVATAGHILGINPFNQPDVEMTKKKTRELISGKIDAGSMLSSEKTGDMETITIFSSDQTRSLADFLKKVSPGNYLALQVFLQPSEEIKKAVDELVFVLHQKTKLPVTSGFGPRYLHSTGQLHKGGRNQGLFIQIAARGHSSVAIPDLGGWQKPANTFRQLFQAQAQGDWLAIRERGRKIIRLELKNPTSQELHQVSYFI